jgi:hypothetical protein
MGLTVLFNLLTPNGVKVLYQEIGSVVIPHPA